MKELVPYMQEMTIEQAITQYPECIFGDNGVVKYLKSLPPETKVYYPIVTGTINIEDFGRSPQGS